MKLVRTLARPLCRTSRVHLEFLLELSRDLHRGLRRSLDCINASFVYADLGVDGGESGDRVQRHLALDAARRRQPVVVVGTEGVNLQPRSVMSDQKKSYDFGQSHSLRQSQDLRGRGPMLIILDNHRGDL